MYRIIGTQQVNAERSLGDMSFETPKFAGHTRAEAARIARAFARDLGGVVEVAIIEHVPTRTLYRVYPGDGGIERVR